MIIERKNIIATSPLEDTKDHCPHGACTRESSEEFLIPVAPTRKMRPSPRVVRFNDNISVHPRNDPILDLDEIKARWLQADEIRQIQQKLNQTLWLMRKGLSPSSIDEEKYCTRGLEHLVDQKANRKARRLVVNSVLTEQDLQRYERMRDDELIAAASREFSEEHRKLGFLRGLFDQQSNNKIFASVLGQENKLMELKRRSAIAPVTMRSP